MKKLNFNKLKNINAALAFPNMATTLYSWEVPLTLEKVIQDVIEGDLVTTTQQIDFKGVWQPLKDEALQFKPEGQRSWEWIWIHAVSSTLNLETADKVIFNQKRYKIVEKKDYSLNGFVEYQLVRDYEDLENPSDAKGN